LACSAFNGSFADCNTAFILSDNRGGLLHFLQAEKASINGQMRLRNSAMRAQPGTQQRPKPCHCVHVNFIELITILIARIFPGTLANAFSNVSS
jgi:hypothetical protein